MKLFNQSHVPEPSHHLAMKLEQLKIHVSSVATQRNSDTKTISLLDTSLPGGRQGVNESNAISAQLAVKSDRARFRCRCTRGTARAVYTTFIDRRAGLSVRKHGNSIITRVVFPPGIYISFFQPCIGGKRRKKPRCSSLIAGSRQRARALGTFHRVISSLLSFRFSSFASPARPIKIATAVTAAIEGDTVTDESKRPINFLVPINRLEREARRLLLRTVLEIARLRTLSTWRRFGTRFTAIYSTIAAIVPRKVDGLFIWI